MRQQNRHLKRTIRDISKRSKPALKGPNRHLAEALVELCLKQTLRTYTHSVLGGAALLIIQRQQRIKFRAPMPKCFTRLLVSCTGSMLPCGILCLTLSLLELGMCVTVRVRRAHEAKRGIAKTKKKNQGPHAGTTLRRADIRGFFKGGVTEGGGFHTRVRGTMFVRDGAVTPGPSRKCDITFFVKGRPKSARQSRDSTVATRSVQSVTVPSSRVSRECRSPGVKVPPPLKMPETFRGKLKGNN